MPDSKLYIEWRESLGSYVVLYRGQVLVRAGTQKEAIDWVESHYPNHAYEVERVQVRSNSPRGVRIGEWHK
jgi:hypothetical protein